MSTKFTKQTPIFVVSLASSLERRQSIRQKLEALGLEFEFFDAVDGKDLTSQQRELVDWNFTQCYKMYETPLTLGEVGCSLSHALLYQKIEKEKIPSAYILEDDAIPSPDFAHIVKSRILEQNPQIKLASLFYHKLVAWRWGVVNLTPTVRAYRPMTLPSSGLCYFIRHEIAARLAKDAFPISNIADWPSAIHQWKGVFCIYPSPVATPPPEASPSIIGSERAKFLAKRMHALFGFESVGLESWPTPLRILGRLAGFTLLPCLLWPRTFGSVRNTLKMARRLCQLGAEKLLGQEIEASSKPSGEHQVNSKAQRES